MDTNPGLQNRRRQDLKVYMVLAARMNALQQELVITPVISKILYHREQIQAARHHYLETI